MKSAKILNSGFWKPKILKPAKSLSSFFGKAKILKSVKLFISGFWKAEFLKFAATCERVAEVSRSIQAQTHSLTMRGNTAKHL